MHYSCFIRSGTPTKDVEKIDKAEKRKAMVGYYSSQILIFPRWQICLIPMQRLLPKNRGLSSLALLLLLLCRAMRQYLKRL